MITVDEIEAMAMRLENSSKRLGSVLAEQDAARMLRIIAQNERNKIASTKENQE